MQKTLFAIGLLLLTLGCRKEPKTPEDSFNAFCLAAQIGSPMGLEKFTEPDYLQGLQNSYDSLAMMAELWPKNQVILKNTLDNGVATLDVEAQNLRGKTVRGRFQMHQKEGRWKVFEGDWTNLMGSTLPDAGTPQDSE